MERLPTAKIRNVAIVGHGGVGKTTLFEALLDLGGAIDRPGSVEDGTTVGDDEPEARRRGMTLSLSAASTDWRSHRLNLLDTPGYPDFAGDAVSALRVADLAVFVVSALDGVQVHTERLWQVASSLRLPRICFVNGLDRERSSFDATLASLRQVFGAGIAPLEMPLGAEGDFVGVLDLLTDSAWISHDGRSTSGPIPDELRDDEHAVHDALVEGIVVADDAQLERYLDGDPIGFDELERTLAVGVDAATVFPVVCGSASARIGIDRLADLICEIGPSPHEGPTFSVTAGGTSVDVPPDASADPLLQVFKTVSDPYVGHISLARVRSGTVRPDDQLVNPRTGTTERLRGLSVPFGARTLPTDVAVAGEIVAIPKLTATATGDCLTPARHPVRGAWTMPLPTGIEVLVRPKSAADDDRLTGALRRLAEEDPGLVVSHDEESHETVLSAQGDLHLAVTAERLDRKFGVHVEYTERPIAYRETISTTATGEGRYKKQSGGHGQFAVAKLDVGPLPRGEGFRFVDRVVGGAIPRQFIPAVEHGVAESLAEGGPLGHPVVDVEVACVDGRHHSVDSSEMSFRMAGRLAVREALAAAGPLLLEPYSQIAVTAPIEQQGDIIGDLNARRGRVLGTEMADRDGHQTVLADVPDAELRRYSVDLRSLTAGRGTFTRTPRGFEPLPDHLVGEVRGSR